MSGTGEFSLALLGYERRQVDAFRDETAAVVEGLHGRIVELEAELERVHRAKPITADRAFANVARETERILSAAQQAGARIVDEARDRAEAALVHARDERARIIGDARRARDEMNRQVRELTSARAGLLQQLEDAVTAIERVSGQLDAAAARAPSAASGPEAPQALTGTDERGHTVAPGPALRVVRGDDRPAGPGGAPPRHRSVSRGRDGGRDPFAARDGLLARPRAAVSDLLGSELAALRDRLREQLRGTPDTGGAVAFDPRTVTDIAMAVSVHLRRAFDLGAESVGRARDQRGRAPSAGDDVVDLERSVVDAVRRHVGEPLRRVLADGGRDDVPPWLLVGRVDTIVADGSAAIVAEIAETALSRAYERGRLASWVHGDVAARRWVVNPRGHRADGECRTNADAGAVPVGTPFPSGQQSPPRHDGCTCTTIAATEESSP